MTKTRLRCAAALLALALAGCGRSTAGGEAGRAGTTAPPSTALPATSPSSTLLPVTSTSPPAPVSTTRPAPAPTTSASTTPAPALGPEWTQRDGRVLIEATASGDPRTLLRDLEALGLRDGVVFGRVVNGWLPVESFPAAQRLGSLQFVRPTGAGTG